MTIQVIYWSGTGNTAAMATQIAAGAREAGAEVVVNEVSQADVSAALEASVLVLGCPSMGAEELEESEFEPFMASIESQLKGKKLVLFGSYGWGDGEWMRAWSARIEQAGASLLAEGLIINETPNEEDLAKCKAFGLALAK